MTQTLDSIISYCQLNRRVCPLPTKWNELHEMLPGKTGVGGGLEPPAPLILAAWYESSVIAKRSRLIQHLKWASDHQFLATVGKFLRSLPEDQWHHLDD